MRRGCRDSGEVAFLPFARLLWSPLNSERGRQQEKKESGGGATYPKQSPKARRPGRERRLCLRSRRRRAWPGRSQPRRAASSRGRPDRPACRSSSRSRSGSGSALAPARTAPRSPPPRLRPEPGPAPGPLGPHLLQRRAPGSPASTARGGRLPRAPGSRLPSRPAGRARGRRLFSHADPAEATSPERPAPAFSEWSRSPGVARPSCLGARSQESSITLEARPHFCPGEGTRRALPGREGAAGSVVLPKPGLPAGSVPRRCSGPVGAGGLCEGRRSGRRWGGRFGAVRSPAVARQRETRMGRRRTLAESRGGAGCPCTGPEPALDSERATRAVNLCSLAGPG